MTFSKFYSLLSLDSLICQVGKVGHPGQGQELPRGGYPSAPDGHDILAWQAWTLVPVVSGTGDRGVPEPAGPSEILWPKPLLFR